MLEDRMNRLKEELIKYAMHIEAMIDKSIQGLLNKDKNLLLEVRSEDETRANEYELEIQELCTTTIAQFEPRAKGLRTILMILMMNNDLERIGDHAVNIVESAEFLIEKPQVKALLDIPRMAEIVKENLRDCINAFINEDAILAQAICERDDIVDALKDQIMRELITYMTSNPETIERSLNLIRIANNLERIADLSTNISEDVIFIVEGRNIKHHNFDGSNQGV